MPNFSYIPRLIEDRVAPRRVSNRAELILGPRQSGKTTLLSKITGNTQCIFLTGEDDEDLKVLSDIAALKATCARYESLVIDEAQFVPDIGRIVKRLVDDNPAGIRIFVTGSSALELGYGFKESAAGRFNSYTLWPFSLSELARQSSWREVVKKVPDYLVYGSLPAVINEPQYAQQYLLDFADTLLYKDLFKLAEVRKPTDLTKLVKYLAANVGSEVRYASVANELGIQSKTVERFVELLEACFLIWVVPSLSRNPVSELKLSKKIYFYDNGIRNAVLRNFMPAAGRPDAGSLWENLFFTELLKKHAFEGDGGEIFFWRTRTKHEVDFLDVVNGQVRAYECKLSEPSRKTTSVRAFERAYPESPVTIATPASLEKIFSSPDATGS